jgi:hypothetical protein
MTAIPELPATKPLIIRDGTDPTKDDQGVDTIRQYAVDLRELADQEKAATEVLETIEQGWMEYQTVDDLSEKLKDAKDRLKQRRLADNRYNDQSEAVHAVKRDKKEAREILSDYLVNHFKITGERQVLMNDANGDAREVILTGKLGRETKYQTSLDLKPGEPEA